MSLKRKVTTVATTTSPKKAKNDLTVFQIDRSLAILQAQHDRKHKSMHKAKEAYEVKLMDYEYCKAVLEGIKEVQAGKVPSFLPTDVISGDPLLVPFALPCWTKGCKVRMAPETLIEHLHGLTIDMDDASVDSTQDRNGLIMRFNEVIFGVKDQVVDYAYPKMKCPGCRAPFTLEDLRKGKCILPDKEVQPFLQQYMRVLEFFRETKTKMSIDASFLSDKCEDLDFPLKMSRSQTASTLIEYAWNNPTGNNQDDNWSSEKLWRHCLSGQCHAIPEWRCPLKGCGQILDNIKGHYSWYQPIEKAGESDDELQNPRFLVLNALSIHLSECVGEVPCRSPFLAVQDAKCTQPCFRAKNLLQVMNPMNPAWEHLNTCLEGEMITNHPLRITQKYCKTENTLGENCHTLIVKRKDPLLPDPALFYLSDNDDADDVVS